MIIPESSIEPFGVVGIPTLINTNDALIYLTNKISNGMTQDIRDGYHDTTILERAELRAKLFGATYIRSGMSQGSHGIDFNVVLRIPRSPVTRRCRALDG